MSKVIGSRLKVQPDSQALETKSGVARKVDEKARMDRGTIVAIGDRVEPQDRFAVGQKVLFNKYGYEKSGDEREFYYVEVGDDRDDVLEVLDD